MALEPATPAVLLVGARVDAGAAARDRPSRTAQSLGAALGRATPVAARAAARRVAIEIGADRTAAGDVHPARGRAGPAVRCRGREVHAGARAARQPGPARAP